MAMKEVGKDKKFYNNKGSRDTGKKKKKKKQYLHCLAEGPHRDPTW
jgi:hypothetical protein